MNEKIKEIVENLIYKLNFDSPLLYERTINLSNYDELVDEAVNKLEKLVDEAVYQTENQTEALLEEEMLLED